MLEYSGWQVETVSVDLGDGIREWIEIRHGDQRSYVVTTVERDAVLREHGIDPARLLAVDAIDDGCE